MSERDLYYRFLVSVITKAGNSENFLDEKIDERKFQHMSEEEIGKYLAEAAQERGLLKNQSVIDNGAQVVFISGYMSDAHHQTHIKVFPKPLSIDEAKQPLITAFFKTIEASLFSKRAAE